MAVDGMQLHPTYVTRWGTMPAAQLSNLVMPGNPIPIADDALTERVEKETVQSTHPWLGRLVSKMPVAPIPYLGVYWVF